MSTIAWVTGAARGIGLELCRQLLDRDCTVVASPRRASEELESLAGGSGGRLRIASMDVADDASVDAAVKGVAGEVDRVDVLFNNAGIYPKGDRLERLELETLTQAFETNAVGALRVTRQLLPLLRAGREKRLIQITSLMGSNGDNTSGGSWAYRISKAAMNMATTNLAHEFGSEGFIALAIHPGWVRTDMGGGAAPLELPPATEEILRIALTSGPEDNGRFKGPGGRTLPY